MSLKTGKAPRPSGILNKVMYGGERMAEILVDLLNYSAEE